MSGSRSRLAAGLTGIAIVAILTGLVLGVSGRSGGRPHLTPLTTEAPIGYLPDPFTTGELDQATAAAVTVLPTEVMHRLLARADVEAGRIRRWTQGEGYADVLVLHASSAEAAKRLVSGALDYVMGLPGGGVSAGKAALFDVPSVPGAQGFFANGQSISTGSPLFVQGVWFTRGQDVFLTEAGSPLPGDTSLAVALAEHQDERLGAAPTPGS